MALVLASQSPRRRQLMNMVSPCFEVDEAAIDEEAFSAQSPALLAQRLAYEKAKTVFLRRKSDVVIGCDTVVDIDGQALGKPKDSADAARMMHLLADKKHLVHTGLAIFVPGSIEQAQAFTETTAVLFGPLTKEEIAAYVKTQEPFDKAGGYAIQGWAARHIFCIEGCYYNILGLPLARLHKTLQNLGIQPIYT